MRSFGWDVSETFLSLSRILVIAATCAYVLLGAGLYFAQGKLLFPAPKEYPRLTPGATGLAFDDLQITVAAGGHLHAWWIPTQELDPTILVFHGNGYVVEQMVGAEISALHETGANLLMVDYRGYGSSSRLQPSERTIDDDARASLRYLTQVRKLNPHRVYVLGRSIGSGPATQLACENPQLGGLILETPLTSVTEVASQFRPFNLFPIDLIVRTHCDNLSKIGSLRMPLLIIAGSSDTLTPPRMAEDLYRRARGPKWIDIIPGASHDDLAAVGGAKLTADLHEFVHGAL